MLFTSLPNPKHSVRYSSAPTKVSQSQMVLQLTHPDYLLPGKTTSTDKTSYQTAYPRCFNRLMQYNTDTRVVRILRLKI